MSYCHAAGYIERMNMLQIVDIYQLLPSCVGSIKEIAQLAIAFAMVVAVFQSWTAVSAIYRAILNAITLCLLLSQDLLHIIVIAGVHLGKSEALALAYQVLLHIVQSAYNTLPRLPLNRLFWSVKWLVLDAADDLTLSVLAKLYPFLKCFFKASRLSLINLSVCGAYTNAVRSAKQCIRSVYAALTIFYISLISYRTVPTHRRRVTVISLEDEDSDSDDHPIRPPSPSPPYDPFYSRDALADIRPIQLSSNEPLLGRRCRRFIFPNCNHAIGSHSSLSIGGNVPNRGTPPNLPSGDLSYGGSPS